MVTNEKLEFVSCYEKQIDSLSCLNFMFAVTFITCRLNIYDTYGNSTSIIFSEMALVSNELIDHLLEIYYLHLVILNSCPHLQLTT